MFRKCHASSTAKRGGRVRERATRDLLDRRGVWNLLGSNPAVPGNTVRDVRRLRDWVLGPAKDLQGWELAGVAVPLWALAVAQLVAHL
jgi:hypothetical protein